MDRLERIRQRELSKIDANEDLTDEQRQVARDAVERDFWRAFDRRNDERRERHAS